MKPSPKNTKKIRAKKRPPCARARYISSVVYVQLHAIPSVQHTASELPPGGDPSQRVRVLTKSDFPPLGTHHFFFARVISRGFCFFCILDESRVSVGCLRNSVNVGLWYSFAKNFCTDKAPFCTYRRMVSVFAKLFPFFSLLLSKVVSDFIQKLHKKKKKSFVENTV